MWIEANVPESWKTPGGHRRARESAVIAAQARELGRSSGDIVRMPVACLTSSRIWDSLTAMLGDLPGARFEYVADALAALIAFGRLRPAFAIVEISELDWDHALVVNQVLVEPQLAHVTVIALCEARGRTRLASPASERLIIMSRDDLTAAANRLRSLIQSNLGDSPEEFFSNQDLPFPVASNEVKRLHALYRTGLVDGPYEEVFDQIVRLAARIYSVPIALISLVTQDRQWFKAHHGLEVRETPRDVAFCNYTILSDSFLVEDSSEDPSFRDNGLVTGFPYIRFYYGVSLRDCNGYAIGSICIIDKITRKLNPFEMEYLKAMAELVSARINIEITNRELHWLSLGGRQTRV